MFELPIFFAAAFCAGQSYGILATADATTFSGILQMATDLFSWVLTSMGDLLDFILQHPLMVIFLIFTIVGFVAGFLFRVWHSVG